jgi:hypothetical protein
MKLSKVKQILQYYITSLFNIFPGVLSISQPQNVDHRMCCLEQHLGMLILGSIKDSGKCTQNKVPHKFYVFNKNNITAALSLTRITQ